MPDHKIKRIVCRKLLIIPALLVLAVVFCRFLAHKGSSLLMGYADRLMQKPAAKEAGFQKAYLKYLIRK